MAEVFFGFVYRWVVPRNVREPFFWMVISCVMCSTTNRQKRTEIAGMTTVKKLIKKNGGFENIAKFNWQLAFKQHRNVIHLS